MSQQELIEMLYNAGFTDGWSLADDKLTVWEHKENPPAPLVRPDETPSPA